MNVRLRPATLNDRPVLQKLIADSARGLSRGDYTDDQVEAALGGAFGVDSELILDGTYFVAEADGRVVRAAEAAGYEAACVVGGGRASANPLAWPRVGLSSRDGWAGFRLKVSPAVRSLRATPLVRPLETAARRARDR